jgi:Raf kinase inhibitor-like YbhB/YbcL family protein
VVGTPTPEAGVVPTLGTGAATAVALASQTLVLKSSAFTTGGAIPGDFTCDGAGQSPPLAWSGAPFGTRAFALVEEDADNQSGSEPFTQWLVYNMPARVTSLTVGMQARPLLPNGAQQGLNSQQTIGYSSPCPNRGDPPHHYNFQLFAQDDFITMETGATADEVRAALNGHIIGQAQLMATLQR